MKKPQPNKGDFLSPGGDWKLGLPRSQKQSIHGESTKCALPARTWYPYVREVLELIRFDMVVLHLSKQQIN